MICLADVPLPSTTNALPWSNALCILAMVCFGAFAIWCLTRGDRQR